MAQFADKARVEQYIRNQPGIVARLLETRLEQGVLDALYADMFPPPTNREKRIALQRVKRLMEHTGYGDQSNLVAEIDREIALLAPV